MIKLKDKGGGWTFWAGWESALIFLTAMWVELWGQKQIA